MSLKDSNGRKKEYRPKYFKNMIELLLEAKDSERFSLTSLSKATTKSIFLSYTETMPPAKIEVEYDRDWKLVWKRLQSRVLQQSSRNLLFMMVHERVFTKARAHYLMPNRHLSPA